MSNKAQRVGSEPHTARGEAECCVVPRDPTPNVFYYPYGTYCPNLMCFSLVKHKTVLQEEGSSAV